MTAGCRSGSRRSSTVPAGARSGATRRRRAAMPTRSSRPRSSPRSSTTTASGPGDWRGSTSRSATRRASPRTRSSATASPARRRSARLGHVRTPTRASGISSSTRSSGRICSSSSSSGSRTRWRWARDAAPRRRPRRRDRAVRRGAVGHAPARRPRRRDRQDRGPALGGGRRPLRASLPGGRGLAVLRDVQPRQEERLAGSPASAGAWRLRGSRARVRRGLLEPSRRPAVASSGSRTTS